MTDSPRRLHGLSTCAYLVVILWGIAQARVFLIPIFLAALLAFLMAPIARMLRARRVPEWLAVTLSTLVLLLPVLIVAYVLVHEGQMLVKEYPAIKESLRGHWNELVASRLGQRFDLEDRLNLSALGDRLADSVGEGFHVFMRGLRALVEATSHLALVFLFAVVMLVMRDHVWRGTERLLSRYETIESTAVLEAITNLVEHFLLARLLLVGVVATVGVIILMLFRVKYGVLLGIVLGLGTLIPAVGYFMGAAVTIAVAIATGHTLGGTLALLAALVALGLTESHVLTPKLVGQRVNINLLATFLGLFAGELLWGVWGMFLSIPLLGILRIALSAVPRLQPWGDLLSEREDPKLAEKLRKR